MSAPTRREYGRSEAPIAAFICTEYGDGVGLYNSGFDPARGISAEPHELRPPAGVLLVGYLVMGVRSFVAGFAGFSADDAQDANSLRDEAVRAAAAADIAARRLFAPTEIPVGVFTGLCGAPYFLWLLARTNRIGRGG